jgi:cytochrome c peroxidase
MSAIVTTGLAAAVVVGIAACAGGANSQPAPGPVTPAELSPLASLGEKIFHDASLSASGRLSCAVCHDAAHALAAADSLAVPLGGADGRQQGLRNAPSLRYVTKTPAFFFAADGTPTGGFDRDGRASSLAEQARRPFLTSFEMANASAADVAARLSAAAYAADFRAVFGAQIFAQPDVAFERALAAIQQYELEDTAEFAPFSSKYDYFLAGKARLTDAELRGLVLFNDPQKGNCAACHPSARGANGEPPLFTDFTYDNIGVPRNADIAANADPAYYDLGLCGPQRTDLADRLDLCGAFKVPTLRNIALTAPYFHNGRFATLTDALGFYVRRDTNPGEWYPTDGNGAIHKFDDLPAQFVANVNRTEVPYNRLPGDSPALDAAEIADVISFLQTLTDGYQP